ncbi:hypothetical protein OA90_27500 [Labrenzia sp. OB1]|nr:hypothetical protein OA90_27500 [Labrenzia sp. OB1]
MMKQAEDKKRKHVTLDSKTMGEIIHPGRNFSEIEKEVNNTDDIATKAKILTCPNKGVQGAATLGMISAIHTNKELVQKFRKINHDILIKNPEKRGQDLRIGFQPASNFRDVNEAIIAGGPLSYNKAQQIMGDVKKPDKATIRIVSYNREGLPPFGHDTGTQNSKHFELNVFTEDTIVGTFFESNTYIDAIMGVEKYGFGELNVQVPYKPRSPESPFEKLFAPEEPNSSFGAPNVLIASNDHKHSFVRSVALYQQGAKYSEELEKLEKLNHELDELQRAPQEESAEKREYLKSRIENVDDRAEKMKNFTPNKISFAAVFPISAEQHHELLKHKALLDAIYQTGLFPTLGSHCAANTCANYNGMLLELMNIDKKDEEHRISELPLDMLEHRIIDLSSVIEGAKLTAPVEPRSIYQDTYVNKRIDEITTKNISANEAHRLAKLGVAEPTLYQPRGERASFFGQYLAPYNKDDVEHEVDTLAANTALKLAEQMLNSNKEDHDPSVLQLQ